MVLKGELFSQRSKLFSQTDWLQEFFEAKSYIIYWSTGSYGLERKRRKSRDSAVSGEFGLGVQNEAGQRLTEFFHFFHWSYQTPSSNNTRDDSTRGYHQRVNTEIRLVIFFAAKQERLYIVIKNKTKS